MTTAKLKQLLDHMRAHGDPAAIAGKARYGIVTTNGFGLSVPFIRALSKETGRDHQLAVQLWRTGIPDCRILAPLIADPAQIDDALMEAWVADLNSWDVCDGLCANLLDRLPAAWDKAAAWSERPEEFVRRAGFVLMARLASRDRKSPSKRYGDFLKRIERGAGDGRNFVKKAVNWALRQMGKRDLELHAVAIATAERIAKQPSASARWIAADALRELRDETQVARLTARAAKRRPAPTR